MFVRINFVLRFYGPKSVLKFINKFMISTDFRYNLSTTNQKNITIKFKTCNGLAREKTDVKKKIISTT